MIRAVALFIRWGLCLCLVSLYLPSTQCTSIWGKTADADQSAIHTTVAPPTAQYCDPHLAEAKMKTIWEDFSKRL